MFSMPKIEQADQMRIIGRRNFEHFPLEHTKFGKGEKPRKSNRWDKELNTKTENIRMPQAPQRGNSLPCIGHARTMCLWIATM